MKAENRAIRRGGETSPPTKIHILTKTVQIVYCVNMGNIRAMDLDWSKSQLLGFNIPNASGI